MISEVSMQFSLLQSNISSSPVFHDGNHNSSLNKSFQSDLFGLGSGSFFRRSLIDLTNFYRAQQLIIVVGFIVVFSILKVAYSWRIWYLYYIPEPVAVFGIGLAFGGLTNYSNEKLLFFNESSFFFVFLPLIIFEAVLHMHKVYFLRNLSSIFIFGFLGTILNFIFIGFSLVCLNFTNIFKSEGLYFQPSDFFMFSVLISPIDSVMVMSVLGDMCIHPNLYFILLGESVINDGVTLVLFDYVSELSCHRDLELANNAAMIVFQGIFVLLVKVVGSCVLGAISGFLTCILTRFTTGYTVVEPLIVLSTSYLTYLLDYSIGWPGVFAMLVYALIQTSYTFENITQKSRITIKRFAHISVDITESLIFLNIGYTMIVHKSAWYTNFILTTLVLSTVSRFIIVYTLFALATQLRWINTVIPPSMKFAIAACGMRGAISHSLVEIVDSSCLQSGGAPQSMIQTTTLFMSLVTVITMGLFMRPLLRLFRNRIEQQGISLFATLNEEVLMKMATCIEDIAGISEDNVCASRIFQWEHRFLRPILLRDPEPYNHIAKVFGKITLALHYASLAPNSSKAQQHLSKLHPTTYIRNEQRSKIITEKQEVFTLERKASLEPPTTTPEAAHPKGMHSLFTSSIWKIGSLTSLIHYRHNQHSTQPVVGQNALPILIETGYSGGQGRTQGRALQKASQRPRLPDTLIEDDSEGSEEDSDSDEIISSKQPPTIEQAKHGVSGHGVSSVMGQTADANGLKTKESLWHRCTRSIRTMLNNVQLVDVIRWVRDS